MGGPRPRLDPYEVLAAARPGPSGVWGHLEHGIFTRRGAMATSTWPGRAPGVVFRWGTPGPHDRADRGVPGAPAHLITSYATSATTGTPGIRESEQYHAGAPGAEFEDRSTITTSRKLIAAAVGFCRRRQARLRSEPPASGRWSPCARRRGTRRPGAGPAGGDQQRE